MDKIDSVYGDQLSGEILTITENDLELKSNESAEPLVLYLNKLKQVHFNTKSKADLPPSLIIFSNGEKLYGKIVKFSNNVLRLKIWEEKEIDLPLSEIYYIVFSTGYEKNIIDSSPQSFVPEPAHSRPSAPKYLDDVVQQKNLSKGNTSSANTISSSLKRQFKTLDGWTGTGIKRWHWLGEEGKSSLEIPAGRQWISKECPLSHTFTFSTHYIGPNLNNRLGHSQQNSNLQPKGLLIVFGGDENSINDYASHGATNDFVALELLPDKVYLSRYYKNKKKKILLNYSLPDQIKQNTAPQYQIKLQETGEYFTVFLNDEKIFEGSDPEYLDIHSQRISFINTDFTPIILKNILLSSFLKTQIAIPDSLSKSKAENQAHLITKDGDILNGSFLELNSDTLRVLWTTEENNDLPKTIDFSSIAGIVFPYHKKTEPHNIFVQTADEGGLNFSTLTFQNSHIQGKHKILGDLILPKHEIKEITFSSSTPSVKLLDEITDFSQAFFINNDHLYFSKAYKEEQSTAIQLHSPLFSSPPFFHINSFSSLQVKTPDFPVKKQTDISQFQLFNGDLLNGELKKISPTEYLLKTDWSSSPISLTSSFVTSLNFVHEDSLLYPNQNVSTFKQWKIKGLTPATHDNESNYDPLSQEDVWEIKDKHITTQGFVTLETPLALPQTIHLAFSAKSEFEDLEFLILDHPHSTLKNSVSNKEGISLKFTQGGLFSLTETYYSTKEHSLVFNPWGNATILSNTHKNFVAHIDIFLNRIKKQCIIYVNGVKQATIATQTKEDKALYSSDQIVASSLPESAVFQITSRSNTKSLISQLSLTRWNGADMGEELLGVPSLLRNLLHTPASSPDKKTSSPILVTHQLQFINGDLLLVKPKEFNNNTLVAQTEDGKEINIRLNKIASIDTIHSSPQQPNIKRFYIRLTLKDNSLITLPLDYITSNEIVLKTEQGTKLNVDKNYVKKVLFLQESSQESKTPLEILLFPDID